MALHLGGDDIVWCCKPGVEVMRGIDGDGSRCLRRSGESDDESVVGDG
jgi:hypothetical protein